MNDIGGLCSTRAGDYKCINEGKRPLGTHKLEDNIKKILKIYGVGVDGTGDGVGVVLLEWHITGLVTDKILLQEGRGAM
jgi:hypothetical protein